MTGISYENIVKSFLGQSQDKTLLYSTFTSYNDFIEKDIVEILSGFNPIVVHTKYLPEYQTYEYVHSINVVNPRIKKPHFVDRTGCSVLMTPNIARTRNFFYAGMLYVDLEISVECIDSETGEVIKSTYGLSNVDLTNIPIMVRSKYCALADPNISLIEPECEFDVGGYFIINGTEKVVINQERISENTILVFNDTKTSMFDYVAEIRSVSDTVCAPPKHTAVSLSTHSNVHGKYIVMNALHYVKTNRIPIFIIFRALGVVSDKEIAEYIVQDPNTLLGRQMMRSLEGSMWQAHEIVTSSQAIDYLMEFLSKNNHTQELMTSYPYRRKVLLRILAHDFLPHIGTDFKKKALFLGKMIRQLLLTSYGMRAPDDRDSYALKRVDTVGTLMSGLFRQHYGKLVKDFKTHIQKDMRTAVTKNRQAVIDLIDRFSVRKLIRFRTLDSGIKYAMSTGTWGSKSASKKPRMGVVQLLNRLNWPSTISHFRRVNTPIEKCGKVIKPRQLHTTQYGVICASESPEGAPIGLLKNLANTTLISNHFCVDVVENDLASFEIVDDVFNHYELSKNVSVFINSRLCGYTTNPTRTVDLLRDLKYRCIVDNKVAVFYDVIEREIHMCSDAGRLLRPLLRIKDGKVMCTSDILFGVENGTFSWDQLLCPDKWSDLPFDEPLIEYVDVQEAMHTRIALNTNDLSTLDSYGNLGEYRYMEIHPALIFGIISSNMNFANHNQSPRVTYCAAMMKQAIGWYHSKSGTRFDTAAHVLTNPQRPLTQTIFGELSRVNDLPYGCNIIVAFCNFSGYNQEDSLIVNQTSVDRGLFQSTVYKTYCDSLEVVNNKNYEEYTCEHLKAKRFINNDMKIHDGGLPAVNSFLKSNDILFGKRSIKEVVRGGDVVESDASVYLKHNEAGCVDRIAVNNNHFQTENAEGDAIALVTLRDMRIPKIGDKFACEAQKGTGGMLYRSYDMPFTESGMTPDIIVNSNALPSRMTVGMVMEMVTSRYCSLTGRYGNGTAFTHGITMGEIAKGLESMGRSGTCEETMYCPTSGQKMPTTIFTGVAFYKKLKHMVDDKIHSRGLNGPIMALTRQSVSGRSKLGATRCGNMETNNLVGMGTTFFTKERLLDSADNYMMHVCAACKSAEVVCNTQAGIYICKVCKGKSDIKEVRMPYCAKLLSQELLGTGIAMRINV